MTDIRYIEERFVISGSVDFDTVSGLLAQGTRLLPTASSADLDFSKVTMMNSGVMVFLIEWELACHKRYPQWKIFHASSQLKGLISLANLQSLFRVHS